MDTITEAKAVLTRLRTVSWERRAHPPEPLGLRVLLYHRVADDPCDALALSPAAFRAQMESLAASGRRGVDLVSALDRLYAGRLAPDEVAITFDDGFRDIEDHALEVLQELGFSATVFVATSVIDGTARYSWADRGLEALSWDDITRLEAEGHLLFEPHSLTHPNLTQISTATCAHEIEASKAVLEERLGRVARAFCYPGGFVGHRERYLAGRAEFDYGVSCEPGLNLPDGDPLLVRRIQIYRTDAVRDFDAKLLGSHDRPLIGRRLYRRLRYGRTGPGFELGERESAMIPDGVDALDDTGDFSYSIVIPSMNRHGLLPDSLRRIAVQTLPPKQVVIVDASDVSFEPEADLLSLLRERGIEILVLKHAPSTSGQRNTGADSVATPLVMFVDDDVHIEPGYAETLIAEWRRRGFETLGGVVGSSVTYPPGHAWPERVYRWAFQLHSLDPAAPAPTFRLSQKVRNPLPPSVPVPVPGTGAGAVLFRTDLARKHRFDERFPGYALGEDFDMSARLAKEAPILEVPQAQFLHEMAPGERASPRRWWYRGRYESYFRLKRLEPTAAARLAFALSVFGELLGATGSTIAERDLSHVKLFTSGMLETVRDARSESRQATS